MGSVSPECMRQARKLRNGSSFSSKKALKTHLCIAKQGVISEFGHSKVAIGGISVGSSYHQSSVLHFEIQSQDDRRADDVRVGEEKIFYSLKVSRRGLRES